MKLNIGSGIVHDLPGFDKWDIASGKQAYPLDLPDSSVDEIYSSYLLQRFGHGRVQEVIREWVRVLKPGGRIRVAVPDYDKLSAMMADGSMSEYEAERYLLGWQTTVHDQHRTLWTRTKLARELQREGVVNLENFPCGDIEDGSNLPFSLNLEGVKRHPFAIKESPSIVVCMSTPRIGFVDNFQALEQSIVRSGIPIIARHCVGSAFWEKSLTLSVLSAIKHHNPDYILTVDYDSVWSPQDVQAIFNFMQSNPWCAAAFPVQMHRSQPFPLVNFGDYSEKWSVAEFGHFGLTMIRTDVFRELPHPWLWSMPGSNGVWDGPNQRDADITFWQNMGEYGYKVVRLNEVIIGHMEQVVIWPDGDKPLYQPTGQYREKGRPEGVRWSPKKADEVKP